jgi:hypothetical protein
VTRNHGIRVPEHVSDPEDMSYSCGTGYDRKGTDDCGPAIDSAAAELPRRMSSNPRGDQCSLDVPLILLQRPAG